LQRAGRGKEAGVSGELTFAVPPNPVIRLRDRLLVRPAEFQSNRKWFFIGHSIVSLFYPDMRASQQTGTKPDWSVAAAALVSERGPAPRSMQARRDEQQAKNARIAVVLSLFLVLLAAALLVGGRGLIDPLLRAAADERESKRVGEIVYTMPDGAYCRRVSFDNATGELTERAIEQCARDISKDRSRTAIGFAWGAR
jgi:hypothetical protein